MGLRNAGSVDLHKRSEIRTTLGTTQIILNRPPFDVSRNRGVNVQLRMSAIPHASRGISARCPGDRGMTAIALRSDSSGVGEGERRVFSR